MSGVMWYAGLRAYEGGPTNYTSRNALSQAIRDGARVVNLSLGNDYFADANGQPDTALMHKNALSTRNILQSELQSLQNQGITLPLIVIAAGNEHQDASFSGYPLLRDDFPQSVIVVGGSTPYASGFGPTPSRHRDGFFNTGPGPNQGSNFGPLVEIYAPATLVSFWKSESGQFESRTGTSLSAPLVAGTAGLLASLNPSLSTAQLKQYLISGAVKGQRSIAEDPTRYVANAYETLRLGATHAGTPVCGNEVHTVALGAPTYRNVVVVERDSSAADTLASTGANIDQLGQLSVAQGGRQIAAGRYPGVGGDSHLFTLASGQWVYSVQPRTFATVFLERDTAYLRDSLDIRSTSPHRNIERLYVRIGSNVASRNVQEVEATASVAIATPPAGIYNQYTQDYPAVSPTEDHLAFRWFTFNTSGCSAGAVESYYTYVFQIRTSSLIEAKRFQTGCAGAGGNAAGFETVGALAWKSDGAELMSAANAAGTSTDDVILRRYTVNGSTVSDQGGTTILDRRAWALYWEPEGTRIRLQAYTPNYSLCETTVRALATLASAITTQAGCYGMPVVGPSYLRSMPAAVAALNADVVAEPGWRVRLGQIRQMLHGHP
jgi:hypothetical protein